jgi:hypothetical protein
MKVSGGFKPLGAHHWRFVEGKPESLDIPGEFEAFLVAGRFYHESVGPKMIRALHVVPLSGRRKDDHGYRAQNRLLPEPLQHFHAAPPRHFQIENDETGQRVLRPVGKRIAAREIIDRLLSIAGDAERILNLGFAERPLKKRDIVFVIFDEQDVKL